MGRWGAISFLIHRLPSTSRLLAPHLRRPPKLSPPSNPISQFFAFRSLSALASPLSSYGHESQHLSGSQELAQHDYFSDPGVEEEDAGNILVKAYFLCTSINLKSMQAENLRNIVPATSRSSNYIALRFCNFPSGITDLGTVENLYCYRYMVVFQYGSAVLFNIEDDEVETYLEMVRRHASGLLPETRKDDYAIKEKPSMDVCMRGGPDYIVLKSLDADGIRIIGSVLGQSIALDYFVSQVDSMLREFADINRNLEKTGTFTMEGKKLFQLVGKANSNLADVIIKVGLFERSEIAWRDAEYAQIHEYLREEYEITQRFGDLDFKLKFVMHNIHFLQKVLQNRRSDLLEWCIIFLLSIENIISVYEIIRDTSVAAL